MIWKMGLIIMLINRPIFFSFIAISHQAAELLFLDWVEKYFQGIDSPPHCRSSGAWWAIPLLKQRSGGA